MDDDFKELTVIFLLLAIAVMSIVFGGIYLEHKFKLERAHLVIEHLKQEQAAPVMEVLE